MKNKIIIIIVFIFGFVVGAITINLMTIPARKSYREMLQKSYLLDQNIEAKKAIKSNNKLKAIIHLSNELSADPVDGNNLFDNNIDKSMDEESFSFILLPYIDQAFEELVLDEPGTKNRIIGIRHGKLAALLDDIGYVEETNYHWTQASSLLDMSEDKVKETFHKIIDEDSGNQMNN